MTTQPEYPDIEEVIEDARKSVGRLQGVWCDRATGFETKISRRRGLVIGGVWSPQFLRESVDDWPVSFVRRLNFSYVLVGSSLSASVSDWLPLLEIVAKRKDRLLLTVEQLDDAVLRMLIMNYLRGNIEVCVARLNNSLNAATALLGKSFQVPPGDEKELPTIQDAFVRRDASLLLVEENAGQSLALDDIALVEIGGSDYEEQNLRLAYAYRLIRNASFSEG